MYDKITVGRFTYDPNTKQIEGPAKYMAEGFAACMANINAGKNAVYNYPNGDYGYRKMLVAIQTDYAGWKGMQELVTSLR